MTILSITKKQLEILILLYRYRFLTSAHIQKFLNHKDRSLIKKWLKDLTQRQIIHRIYFTKRGDINSPAIYYLANKASPILREKYKECNSKILDRVYTEKTRSNSFIARCLFVADLYFHFQAAAGRQKVTCSFYTATDLTDVAYSLYSPPDVYLVVKGKETDIYVLDYFEERLPMKEIRKRVGRYFTYFKDRYWQDHNKEPFPTILLVCSLPRVQESIKKLIEDEADPDISFFLTQKSDIQADGIKDDTWETII